MSDMVAVTAPRSDQWNFDDFLSGSRTFRIVEVRVKPGTEQPVDMVLEGTEKFYRPCKSMARCFVAAWGPDSKKYVGRSITLYGDPKVRWGGLEVGGIRISHMSDIDSPLTMALTMTRGNKKPFTVKPLVVEKVERIDPQPYLTAIAEAKTLDELKEVANAAWKLFGDAEIRASITAAKDKRKTELSEAAQ